MLSAEKLSGEKSWLFMNTFSFLIISLILDWIILYDWSLSFFANVLKERKISFSVNYSESDAFIIAVPTPLVKENNKNPKPDISYIKKVSYSLSKVIKKGDLIILESTSPVGTTESLSKWLSAQRSDLKFPHNNKNPDIFIAYCPERVLPGNILNELVNNHG